MAAIEQSAPRAPLSSSPFRHSAQMGRKTDEPPRFLVKKHGGSVAAVTYFRLKRRRFSR